MVLKTLILITLLTRTAGECTAGDENCQANYDGEDSGLAQIKAHKAQKKGSCPKTIIMNHAEAGGHTVGIETTNGNDAGDRWHQCKEKCDANEQCVAWTMKYQVQNGDPGDCYLKDSAPWNNGYGWHEDWGVISGSGGGGGAVGSMCMNEDGVPEIMNADTTDIPAIGEMSNPGELHGDWKQCMYACKDTGDCVSYTYIVQNGVDKCYKKGKNLPGEDGKWGFYTFTTGAVSGDKP